VSSAADLARRVDRACQSASGPVAVERAVAAVIREAMPYDAWCVLTVDPATALPTGGYHEEGVPADRTPHLAEIDARGEDALALADLARSRSRVGTLSAATGGQIDRSQRYREVLAPSGLEHEMRIAFSTNAGLWGAFVAFRAAGEPDFSTAETQTVERATRSVVGALRRELLLTEISDDAAGPDGPGLVLLDRSLARRSTTQAAERWLEDLEDGLDRGRDLPLTVISVAGRARDVEAPQPVRARVRTRSGRWLTMHAERLGADGDISVIVEPTRPLELAALIADAYGLTAREREVVHLLALGHSRAEIAKQLVLSPHTVDDHVKRALAKVQVRSRAELTAKLFFDQNLPRMHADVPVGGTGWFLR
jgi:DNA-binding CsgD family transcriptional regulator